MSLSIGWFTAGRGPGSMGMFEHTVAAIEEGTLDAEIRFVFMHRERGEGAGTDAFIEFAESRGIPVLTYSAKRFREAHGGNFAEHRSKFDSHVLDLIRPFEPDLCVLAGYLLILSDILHDAFHCINLHPALPNGPVGLWQKVIWELIETRAHESGIMTILVTGELDKGPPLTYAKFPIVGNEMDPLWHGIGHEPIRTPESSAGEDHPLFQAIREKGVQREPLLLTETLKSIASGEIRISKYHLVDRYGKAVSAQDLTSNVDAEIERTNQGPRRS